MIITILIAVLVLFVAFWVIGEMALPSPINMVARVVVGIIGLIYLLSILNISLP